jgi:YHS domain-containing protein
MLLLLRLVLLSMVLGAWTASAQDKRVMLKGHDPVAYFTEARPVKGSPQFAYDWDGDRYYFASAANREKFAADPDRYAPQFGGYCTGSMSRNVVNEMHPEAWVISEGKLYVFGQPKFRDIALKDPEWLRTRIPLAAANWQEKHPKK